MISGIKDESNSFKGLMKNCLIDSSDDASSEFKEKQTSRQLYAEPRNMPLGSPKELHLWAPNEMVDRYQIVRTPLQNTYRRKKV